jgi:hypothetical protein
LDTLGVSTLTQTCWYRKSVILLCMRMAFVLRQQCGIQHAPSAPSCASILGNCTAHSRAWKWSRHGFQYVFSQYPMCAMLIGTSGRSACSERYCAFTRDTWDTKRHRPSYSKRDPCYYSSSYYEHICRRCEVSHSRWTPLLVDQRYTGTRSTGSLTNTT